MYFEATGVFEDGSLPRGSRVPDDSRKPLKFVFGSDVVLRLKAVTANGEPLTVVGRNFYWTIGPVNDELGIYARTRQGVIDPGVGDGEVVFILTSNDTELLPPGLYQYDVWFTGTNEQEPLIPLSPLIVEPALYSEDPGPITFPPVVFASQPQALCTSKTLATDFVIQAGNVCYKTDLLIADGAELFINDEGELVLI